MPPDEHIGNEAPGRRLVDLGQISVSVEFDGRSQTWRRLPTSLSSELHRRQG